MDQVVLWTLGYLPRMFKEIPYVSMAPEDSPLSGGHLGNVIFKVVSNSEIKLLSMCLPLRNQELSTILHC